MATSIPSKPPLGRPDFWPTIRRRGESRNYGMSRFGGPAGENVWGSDLEKIQQLSSNGAGRIGSHRPCSACGIRTSPLDVDACCWFGPARRKSIRDLLPVRELCMH